MTTIVQEMPKHYAAVRQLTIEAFAHSDLGHNGEADLIEAIRKHCDISLSLVAIKDNHVVGHILFSPATIRTESSTIHGMALAPLAVLPLYQRLGIGAMLVTEGLRRIIQSTADFIIVAGHRDYYPRFGFISAQDLSIIHGFKGMPQDILFIRMNDRNRSSLNNGGRVYFDTAFGLQYVG
jgi:putative acetyltransferase